MGHWGFNQGQPHTRQTQCVIALAPKLKFQSKFSEDLYFSKEWRVTTLGKVFILFNVPLPFNGYSSYRRNICLQHGAWSICHDYIKEVATLLNAETILNFNLGKWNSFEKSAWESIYWTVQVKMEDCLVTFDFLFLLLKYKIQLNFSLYIPVALFQCQEIPCDCVCLASGRKTEENIIVLSRLWFQGICEKWSICQILL